MFNMCTWQFIVHLLSNNEQGPVALLGDHVARFPWLNGAIYDFEPMLFRVSSKKPDDLQCEGNHHLSKWEGSQDSYTDAGELDEFHIHKMQLW